MIYLAKQNMGIIAFPNFSDLNPKKVAQLNHRFPTFNTVASRWSKSPADLFWPHKEDEPAPKTEKHYTIYGN